MLRVRLSGYKKLLYLMKKPTVAGNEVSHTNPWVIQIRLKVRYQQVQGIFVET